jgi:hypothetical protein
MPPIVGKEGQVVPQGRGSDEQIEVANGLPQLAQSSPLSAENSACAVIEFNEFYTAQKLDQVFLASFRVKRIEHSFVQFGK